MQTVEIQAVETYLQHPSGKNKLTFELFNKEFTSKNYSLVILLNTCRQKEDIVLSTHGQSTYEVYLNKGCITDKQSVLNIFAELISTTDDNDRSNTFIVSELTNFNQSKKITLFGAQEYEATFPYVWLFKYNFDKGKVNRTVLRSYTLKIASNDFRIGDLRTKTFANLSLTSTDSNIESAWRIRNGFFKSNFLTIDKLDIEAIPDEQGTSWGFNYNVYTSYDYINRKVIINSLKSDVGIQLPLFEPPGQIETSFSLSFEFLYKLDYSINIIHEISKQYFSNACNSNGVYCVELKEKNETKPISYELSFNEKDLRDFFLSGFDYQRFLEMWLNEET